MMFSVRHRDHLEEQHRRAFHLLKVNGVND